MTATTATFGGIPLDAHAPISWTSRPGVLPDRATWLLDAGTADAIWAQRAQPMDLVYDIGDGPVTVRGLYALSLEPGDNPYTKRIRVADRRYKWGRVWVSADYNLQRKAGDKRLVNNTLELANSIVVDVIRFAPWSLKDGTTRWTALEVIDDIMVRALGEPVYTVAAGDKPQELRLEELPLDTDGATALARALEFTPGLNVKLNEDDGLPMLYAVSDGSERVVIDEVGPPNVGMGYPGVTDRRAERPRMVRVLFSPEIEARVDCDHENIIDDTNIASDPATARRVIFPVIAVADPQFFVDGVARTNGEWITQEQFFDNVNAAINGGLLANGRHSDIPLSEDRVLKHTITPVYAYERLDVLYAVDKAGYRDASWSNRIGQLRGAYRQIYRIHRSMIDRFRTWTLQRVGILDEQNQTRGTTQAYTNWIRRPSWAGIEERGMGSLAQPWYVEGYADDLANARGAPVSFSIMDRDNGVFRVAPVVTEWENTDFVAFGKFENNEMPAYSAAIAHQWHHQVVSREHKIALVIVATPAAPAKSQRLYEQTVTPSEVSALVGYDVGQGEGPVIEVRIGAGLQTARFAWLDSAAADWDDWWSGEGPPLHLMPGLVNESLLRDIALAAAAQVYDTYMDAPENAYAVGLTGKARIAGTITSIRHTLSRAGDASTQIRTSGTVLERNPWQRMPDSARRILERLVLNP